MKQQAQGLAHMGHPEMFDHFSPELVPLHMGASRLGVEDNEATSALRMPGVFEVEA